MSRQPRCLVGFFHKPLSSITIVISIFILAISSPSRKIALTFDDGPSAYTDSILDLLERYGGRSTIEIQRASAAIESVTGVSPPMHRPPFGMSDDTRPTTAEAMTHVIPRLIEEGFELVTVSELLYYLYGGLEPGRIYGTYTILEWIFAFYHAFKFTWASPGAFCKGLF